jgi:hypothetical protein
VYQQQQQQEQQQEQQQQQDAENPFLDPPFSRIKIISSQCCMGVLIKQNEYVIIQSLSKN